MDHDAKLVTLLLLEASDSTSALANLHRFKKGQNDNWSMQFVCKKAGIPSTGYFSDVLKGKRRLNGKYIPGIQKAFGLSTLHTQYLEKLLAREQTESPQDLASLDEEIARIRGLLEVDYIAIPAELSQGLLFHVWVLSSFSLFPGGPTLADLEGFFGRALNIPLAKSLHKLQTMGFVEIVNGRYRLTKTRIIFQDSQDGFSHYDFLEKSIAHAAKQVRVWFPKSDESIFLSSVVSVAKANYETKVPEIRSKLMRVLAEMEDAPGDLLVQFNMQIFPFDPQALKP